MPKDRNTLVPLGPVFQGDLLFFFIYLVGFLRVSVHSHWLPHSLSLRLSEEPESIFLITLQLLAGCCYVPTKPSLLLAGQAMLPQLLLKRPSPPAPTIIRDLRLDVVFQIQSECQVEGGNCFSASPGCAPADTAQGAVSLRCCQGPAGLDYPAVSQDPRPFSTELYPGGC